MGLFSDLWSYCKYHFFEVKVEEDFKIKYRKWAFLRLLRVLVRGRKKSESYLFPYDVVVENKFGKFFVPKNSDMVLSLSTKFEADMLHHFTIKEGGVFFDIGGNAGKYATYIALNFKPKMVYTFEPSPTSSQIIETNIGLNNLTKVRLAKIGLSDKKSELLFANAKSKTGLSHIVLSANEIDADEYYLEKVQVNTLDNFIEEEQINIQEVDFIKIDVEGHELNVLKGAKQTLQHLQKGTRILIECPRQAEEVKPILEFMKGYNFKVVQLNIEYYLFTLL